MFGGTAQYKKKKQQEISSYISSAISSQVIQFSSENEVLSYLSCNPVSKISAVVEKEVEIPVTSYVELSNETYDDGIPVVNSLDFGFYAVP